MLAQFLERETRGVFAFAAARTVEVGIVDVREGCSLELGVFHVRTLACKLCGLLLYNSYSIGSECALYSYMKADAAERLAVPASGLASRPYTVFPLLRYWVDARR